MYPYEFTESATERWLRLYVAQHSIRCKWWLRPLSITAALVAHVVIWVCVLSDYYLLAMCAVVLSAGVVLVLVGTLRAEKCRQAYCRYQEAKRLYEAIQVRHAEQERVNREFAGIVKAENTAILRQFAAIVAREFGEGDFPTFERPSD